MSATGEQQHVDTSGSIEKVSTKRMALYTGRTHPTLAAEVAQCLNLELGNPNIVQFANGEIRARFADALRRGLWVTRLNSVGPALVVPAEAAE